MEDLQDHHAALLIMAARAAARGQAIMPRPEKYTARGFELTESGPTPSVSFIDWGPEWQPLFDAGLILFDETRGLLPTTKGLHNLAGFETKLALIQMEDDEEGGACVDA